MAAVWEEVDKITISSSASQEELANAIRPHYEAQSPVVLRGAVSNTPAMKLWPSFEYWHQTFAPSNNTTTAGTEEQLGAVEIGGSYGNADMERAEIPIQSYLQYLELFEERHGRTGPEDPSKVPNDTIPMEELVYMAQTNLVMVACTASCSGWDLEA
jgi:hypothetical protein